MRNSEGQQNNAPDGGWGWVVVGAVALINTFNQSLTSIFGLLFSEHLQNMKEETVGAALVTNLNCFILNFSGLFIAPAIKNFSARAVAFVGCLLTSFGVFICALSTKLWHVILGYSFFVGIGLGLIAPSTFMVINSYFTTKRGRAVGIALAGTGIGQMIIPQVVRILLDQYGFCTTTLVLSGLALHGLIGACLFRPIKKEESNARQTVNIKLLLDFNNEEKRQDYEIAAVKVEVPSSADIKKSKSKKLCKKIFKRISQAMDLELLNDPVFWNAIVGISLVYTATMNFSMLYPYFLQFSVGMDRKDTAFCMSALAGADIVCRLLLPFLTDKLKVPYRIVFLSGVTGLLISRAVIAESFEFYSFVIVSIFYGGSKAATVINSNLTISSHCKPEKLAGGLGLNMILKALVVISVGQVLGWLRDYTGSYSLSLHAQNILLLIVMISWTVEIICKYLHKRKCKVKCGNDSIL